jgi:predicted GIY-YIG superfamily endonuclease
MDSLSGADFKTFKKPLVYIWKRGDEFLYVGSSERGIIRMLEPHYVISELSISDDDVIRFEYFETKEEAVERELYLQQLHRPRYNKIQGQYGPKAYNAVIAERRATELKQKPSKKDPIDSLLREISASERKKTRDFNKLIRTAMEDSILSEKARRDGEDV